MQKQNQHKNRKTETYTMKTKTTQKNNKKWKQFGFQKRMLRKFYLKNRQTLAKEKQK